MSTSDMNPVDAFIRKYITTKLEPQDRKLDSQEFAKVKAIKDERGDFKFEESAVPTTLADLREQLAQEACPL